MKLHLPVRLFRSVVALCSLLSGVGATVASVSYAAAPEDAVEVILINEDDLARAEHTVNDREFLVKADLLFDGVSSPYMGADAESWYFSGTPELSMIFTHATNRVFDVAKTKTLEFDGFEEVSFMTSTSSRYTIYVDNYSTITLSNNGTVLFSLNTYSPIWGTQNSTITLSNNGTVTFSRNTDSAIYGSDDSTITLNNNDTVTFSRNTNRAICGTQTNNTITLRDNGTVIFSGNSTSSGSPIDDGVSAALNVLGGAIHGDSITLSDNDSISFSGNSAASYISYYDARGGAIYGDSVAMNNNGMVTFNENSADDFGGAIYGGTITLSKNDTVLFSGNSASEQGGAIYGESNSTITLSNNGSVSFSENSVHTTNVIPSYGGHGGAIYGKSNSSITMNNNSSVTFSGNSASYYGGAIYGAGGKNCMIELSGNESVTFSGNSVFYSGGAIYGGSNSTISLCDNGSVMFSANTSTGGAIYGYSSTGGAIYGYSNSTISLSNNGSVIFSGNSASTTTATFASFAYGGAIYGYSNSTITLSNNGSVIFSGNSASGSSSAWGGVIYGDDDSKITLSGNKSVTFSGNTASSGSSSATGGAICIFGDLNIRNNGSVLFEKNAEKSGSSYRLSSIYCSGGTLSAAEGKSIEFRDSVRIGSRYTVELNADYTDAEGVVHKQMGDIIFTGKYTEQHLNELLAADGLSRTATAEEILNSRTTEVKAMTNLYGGCLRVEDGAIYKGYGITAMGNSAACVRVKDAVLEHGGYDIMLNPGTKLEVEGASAITADELVMKEGSSLSFVLGEKNKSTHALTLTGTLVLNGAVSLVLDDELQSGLYRLMKYTELTGDVAQLEAGLPEHYELAWKNNEAALIVWQHLILPREESEWNEFYTYTKANAESDVVYNSVRLNGGIHEVSGSGSMGVGGLFSVTEGADVTLAVNAFAMAVEVGDDSSLSIRKGLNLVSLTMQADEGTEETKAISVGRNAELCLTEATLLGQVEMADETSAVYYQTESGEKLLKFTGELGTAGLNLTTGTDGKTVSATDSAGFTGDITVLSGVTLVNAAESTVDSLPFGDNYATAPDRKITVQSNAALDINGRGTYYHLVLENNTLLKNSGTDAHLDWKGLPVIELAGDAEVNAAAQICMVGANYATNTLDLNGNTLTKTGGANLVLRNTNISEGSLAVNEGVVRFMGTTSTDAGTGIQVNNGGTLWISEGTGSYAGSLVVNTGGHVYLGEGPSGTLGGDNGTNSDRVDLSGLSSLELNGGTLTFRGACLTADELKVTQNSVLEIWDQVGGNGVTATASVLKKLNLKAALNLTTTWKSELNVDILTGNGALTVGGSREQHRVNIADISGYTGTFAADGANSTLALNLSANDVLEGTRITLTNGAMVVLGGSGTYDLGATKSLSPGVNLGEDWIGAVRLRGAVLENDTLAGLSNANSVVELNGVSGFLSRADAKTGAQTYGVNLKLTDNGTTAAWTLDNGYKGDERIFTGEISGTGTLSRSSYKGTNQTLVFAGDTSGWTGVLKHEPNADKNSGATVETNVTFSGTQNLNVSMTTNGKGELNVTLDDEHLAAGKEVTVNGRISADTLTVTEGTRVNLMSAVSVDTLRTVGTMKLASGVAIDQGETTLVTREEADRALFFGIESTEDSLLGLREDSELRHVSISGGAEYRMQNLELENVSYTAEQSVLTLQQVAFSGDCMFSVGETGTILLDEATLMLSVGTHGEDIDGVLTLDYSNLFHCMASGELEITMDKDVATLRSDGYHAITLNLGDDVNYDNLNMTLNGATYIGNSQGVAYFSLHAVPEPTTAALSLLSLAALAARRRRKQL